MVNVGITPLSDVPVSNPLHPFNIYGNGIVPLNTWLRMGTVFPYLLGITHQAFGLSTVMY